MNDVTRVAQPSMDNSRRE